MSEWRTIDSAPKDGRPILGYWMAYMQNPCGVVRWSDSGAWYEDGRAVSDPNFWFPLPEPPVSPSGENLPGAGNPPAPSTAASAGET